MQYLLHQQIIILFIYLCHISLFIEVLSNCTFLPLKYLYILVKISTLKMYIFVCHGILHF
jgi:phosphate starvation-inducible membrane PsiE